jgi:dTDP-4-dehydrorhamnose 3,5-epimerase
LNHFGLEDNMRFTETKLTGAYLIDLERREDSRGYFARTFCSREFEEHGLSSKVVQCNVAFNHRKGTVRGLHYQAEPASEVKLVRCLRGAIYDVIVDLRPESPTYRQHLGVQLTAENALQLFIPEGFGHGYQTLTPEAELMYLTSEFHAPACERGIRYNDPALGIQWPLPVTILSEKDACWPLLEMSNAVA